MPFWILWRMVQCTEIVVDKLQVYPSYSLIFKKLFFFFNQISRLWTFLAENVKNLSLNANSRLSSNDSVSFELGNFLFWKEPADQWCSVPCWFSTFCSSFSVGGRHIIKWSIIFTTASSLSQGNNLLSTCAPLCKQWRTCDKFVCISEIWSFNAVCSSLVIPEFSLPRVYITKFYSSICN